MTIRSLIFALALTALAAGSAHAQDDLTVGQRTSGTLSESDRVSDDGGRSRDYKLRLQANQIVVISVKSQDFDTVVGLYDKAGSLVSENDDRDGGGTDSLLIASVTEPGDYTVRVRSYGGGGEATGTGAFTVKATVVSDD